MAEKAAHLTSTSYPKPSIFEIIAQDSLNATIHPALQKLILFLSTYNPRKFGWIVQYCDEIYLVLNGLIQYNYVKKYEASFSEHFYGLKRITQVGDQNISNRQKILSLLFLVILPYLKIKLEEKLVLYRLNLADGVVYNKWEKKLKTALCSSHGLLHFSWILWSVSQYLKYMSGKTDVQTPILKMLALKLTYEEEEEESEGFWSALLKGQITFGLISQALSNSLEIGAFFVQFLRSWQDENSNISLTALPMPDPSQYDPNSSDYKGKCPLCMQKWKVPTVVNVSGYIYCYRCITNHLQKTHTCPVTNFPVNTEGIVRLYDIK